MARGDSWRNVCRETAESDEAIFNQFLLERNGFIQDKEGNAMEFNYVTYENASKHCVTCNSELFR